jgi:hypothetical protein
MSMSRIPWAIAIIMIGLAFEAIAQGSAKNVDGIFVQTIQIAAGKNMNLIKFPLDRFDVRVLSPSLNWTEGYGRDPDRKAKGFYLEDYKRRFDAVAVQAGGYIDSYSPPTSLGLVRSNGQVVSRQRDSWLTEAALCSDTGNVKIDLVDLVRLPFRDCVQAGPLLLRSGKPPSDLPSRKAPGFAKLSLSVQEQNFACVASDGRILLGVTDKIDLPTLVFALQRPEVSCVDAIRLTGLDTAGLRIGTTLFGNDDYLYPNAIGVVRRSLQ